MKYNTSDYNLLAEYYEAHFDELRQFVGSRVNFAYETEDIVQNVFLRLLKSDKMITSITLPCLVYTVARNLIFDYWRHHTRLQEHEHQLQTSSLDPDTVESIYSAQEMNELLERGIAQLSDTQQRVYRLNIYEGKKVSDIAYELSMNYKGVERNLGNARKHIRHYMRRMLA